MNSPIIDLHCDLLSYLSYPDTSIYNADDIGCAIPHMNAGNVKLQVMALFAPTKGKSHLIGKRQSEIFATLDSQDNELYRLKISDLAKLESNDRIGMVAAVENASVFCDEEISLKKGLENFKAIKDKVGRIFYVSLTHHTENRFGGGNYSQVGLKNDGMAFLEFMEKQQIAIDLSHTSDALAHDILNYRSKQNLEIPVIASHSNYRDVWDHPRNLPNELAQEIVHLQGLIGVNFVRAFVDNENPDALISHIAHGIELGAQDAICYGADYFYHKEHSDRSRVPFYHPEHEDSRCYPQLSETIATDFGQEIAAKLSYKNVVDYIKRVWN